MLVFTLCIGGFVYKSTFAVPTGNENVAYANQTNSNTIMVDNTEVYYEFVSANYIWPMEDKLAVRVTANGEVTFNFHVQFVWTNGKSKSNSYTQQTANLNSPYELIIGCTTGTGSAGTSWSCNRVIVSQISFISNGTTVSINDLTLYF